MIDPSVSRTIASILNNALRGQQQQAIAMIPESNHLSAPLAAHGAFSASQGDLLPALVAQVFEEAPLPVRGRLLEHLLKPLSLLSLAAVANGIFARITIHQGWHQRMVSPEGATQVNASDVVALVHHVQQVSVQAIDGLASIISASPVLTGSATAAMLLTVLTKQAKNRAPVLANDFDPIC